MNTLFISDATIWYGPELFCFAQFGIREISSWFQSPFHLHKQKRLNYFWFQWNFGRSICVGSLWWHHEQYCVLSLYEVHISDRDLLIKKNIGIPLCSTFEVWQLIRWITDSNVVSIQEVHRLISDSTFKILKNT